MTTHHFLATQVGKDILSEGGNSYDAAIAISFTLAVVLPRAGNIGGGGFMVMHDSETNKEYSIDYREKAPAASNKDMYWQVNAIVNDKIDKINSLLNNSKTPGIQKIYHKDMIKMISNFKKNPTKFKKPITPKIPDGSPIGNN